MTQDTQEKPHQIDAPVEVQLAFLVLIRWFEETYKDAPTTKGADFLTKGIRGTVRIFMHYLQEENGSVSAKKN